MQENENTITPDHEAKLAENFEHITFLINNNIIDEAKEQLLKLHYADLADFLDNTNNRLYPIILESLGEDIPEETIVSLSESSRQPVLEALGVARASKLIEKIDIEDSIEVVDVLDEEFKQVILDCIDVNKKQQILEGFNYPENSVGRIVERDYVSFQRSWNVGQAIDYIRKNEEKADFHAAIIVDSRGHPVGNLMLSSLLKYPRSTVLKEIMNDELKVADTFTEIDDLVYIFKQYALTIVPVTNKAGKLVGTVSIDNMIYIVGEQAESEFMQLGGINTSDIFENLFETSRHRFPWLFVNLVTACITSMIIDEFSETIVQLITLATMMPIVAALSGSVGTQVMTVTVRAIANREINQANSNKIVIKEIIVSALNGLLIATIGALLTYVLFGEIGITIIFSGAIILNFVFAGLFGSCIPITMNRMDLDPATASGVFVSAFTDALSFFSFLGFAYLFLV